MSYVKVVILGENDEEIEPDELTTEGRQQARHLAKQLIEQIDTAQEDEDKNPDPDEDDE